MTVTLYTYEWLPEFPRGFVRDMRVRWALEELGQPYTVATVPVHPKTDAHRAMQPFGQVPMIEDGDLRLFESGAIVLHLADGSPLLPPARRAEVTQWLIAALNSIELPDALGSDPAGREATAILRPALAAGGGGKSAQEHECQAGRNGGDPRHPRLIAGDFSAADILLADVLRVPEAEGALADYPALTAYVARATARPAFQRALADHMAHWATADAARATQPEGEAR